MQKTTKTLEMYKKVVNTIIRQAKEGLPDGSEITPMILVYTAWNYYKLGKICRRTWRMRKAALKVLFEKMAESESLEASSLAKEAIDTLDTLSQSLILNRNEIPKMAPLRTSQKKGKVISPEDNRRFQDHLIKRRDEGHVAAGVLHDWIVASGLIGCRPSEWKDATCNGRNVRIVNGKSTHGRSHGKYRTVPIDYLPQEKRDIIIRHISYIAHWSEQGNSFDDLQKGMVNLIYRESRLCWPRKKTHVSLYTFRHQFSANLKATGLDKESIAALMGHASTETAGRHYARKITGNPVEGIYAASDDLRRVRAMNQSRKSSKYYLKMNQNKMEEKNINENTMEDEKFDQDQNKNEN